MTIKEWESEINGAFASLALQGTVKCRDRKGKFYANTIGVDHTTVLKILRKISNTTEDERIVHLTSGSYFDKNFTFRLNNKNYDRLRGSQTVC